MRRFLPAIGVAALALMTGVGYSVAQPSAARSSGPTDTTQVSSTPTTMTTAAATATAATAAARIADPAETDRSRGRRTQVDHDLGSAAGPRAEHDAPSRRGCRATHDVEPETARPRAACTALHE